MCSMKENVVDLKMKMSHQKTMKVNICKLPDIPSYYCQMLHVIKSSFQGSIVNETSNETHCAPVSHVIYEGKCSEPEHENTSPQENEGTSLYFQIFVPNTL